MRIGLGNLGDYQGPSPVVLLSGKTITDPANTPASDSDCLPYQCGEDTSNIAAHIWCAYWGKAANRSCVDPMCADYQTACVFRPLVTTPVLNAQVAAPVTTAAVNLGMPPTLTPQNITQPLPDITLALQPVVQPCSMWGDLNGWIGDHPGFAAAILVAGFLIARRYGK